MHRGSFVVFEGIDASGKSTQARRVAELHDAHFTFEPGDTPLGVDLRRWVLDATTPMTPITEALLMLAETVKRLGCIRAEAVLDVKESGRLRWPIGARQVLPFVQQLDPLIGSDGQIAIRL